MQPWSAPLSGRLDEHVVVSDALRGNPLGDPYERPLWVYVPPGYDPSGAPVPSIYVIQGFTGHVEMWRNRSPFRPTFLEATDALFAGGTVAPCLVVFVDAWTAYGGSQFVDSPGTGRYHTYLCDEIVPYVDTNYRTRAQSSSRAISGKSSGGFGAMITPMLRPDLFGALASHAGDSLYEMCYVPEFGEVVRHLRAWDGDILRWWDDFRSRTAFTRAGDDVLLGILAVAACFSARDDGTPVLPFDPRTGELDPMTWQHWLDWDPVRMVDRYASACRSWHSLWIDAGTRDEWYLDLGAQAFRDKLAAVGVPHERIRFELFDATHRAIDYRYPLALEWLAGRLER